jgi:uncharacterized protein (TIGR02996 family)
MHPEADALLDAIFDHPDDDTPRLVYADWLQEHGQEDYAQFIRLQCAAAREKLWSEEANRLWVEIGRVWYRLDGEWWPATRERWLLPCRLRNYDDDHLASPIGLGWRWLDAIHFWRGFLYPKAAVTAEQLLRYALLCPSFGPVSSLRITFNNDALKEVADLPALRWVQRVECSSWAESNYVQPLASALNELLCSRHFRRVKVIDLSTYSLMEENVSALLTTPNLASVEELLVLFGDESDCDPEEALPRLRGRFKRVIHE